MDGSFQRGRAVPFPTAGGQLEGKRHGETRAARRMLEGAVRRDLPNPRMRNPVTLAISFRPSAARSR
jgi:hypothetical protein